MMAQPQRSKMNSPSNRKVPLTLHLSQLGQMGSGSSWKTSLKLKDKVLRRDKLK